MRRLVMLIVPAALVAAPLAFAAPPAQSAMPMQSPPASSKVSVDSATLHKFASAYEDVRQVRIGYVAKFKAANTATQKTAVKAKAIKTMKQHIAKHMPLAEYIKVSKAVSANPTLRTRLIAILKADQKKPAPGAMHGG